MKKRLGVAALAVVAGLGMQEKKAGNPLFPGWYADPDVEVFKGECWVYPTYSDVYEKQTFMDAFSSPDLVTWTKHPRIIDTKAVAWAKRAMWAPCVVEKEGKYYIFFGANDVHEGEGGGRGVGVSDSPGGPFRDHLGKPLINEIVNGAQPIDQAVFQDSKGQWLIVYGGWRHCNIAKLKSDFTGIEAWEDGKKFHEITPEGYVEGPMMFERGGKWYFMWSEGAWTNSSYQVAYAMADSPMGPFKRIGTVIQPNAKIGGGAGHHSILKLPGKDEYFIVYHRRPPTTKNGNHRQTCMDKMEFNADGTIKPVVMTVEGPGAHAIAEGK